jgi:hypothetical protein
MKPKVIHGDNLRSRGWTGGMDVTLKTFAHRGWADQYPFKTIDSVQGLTVSDRLQEQCILGGLG